MPTSYTSPGTPNVTTTIPAAGDPADIVTAFQSYHNNVGNAIVTKANINGQVFTANITAPNIIANTKVTTATLTTNAYVDSNTIANANAQTVTVEGLAYSAVRGARYFGTSSNVNAQTTALVNQSKIIVSLNQPTGLEPGDVWISWTV